MTNLTMASKCSSVTVHFEGLGDVLVQYKVYRPMHHVQGHTESHWMLPLGNYSLHIAPAATRATANKKTMNKCTLVAGHFDSHGSAHNSARIA
jgi:hypothetical protein